MESICRNAFNMGRRIERASGIDGKLTETEEGGNVTEPFFDRVRSYEAVNQCVDEGGERDGWDGILTRMSGMGRLPTMSAS